ncbi:MAG: hypothetical protein Kow0068_01710 [Marinilabiliales bacterium]
MKIKLYVFGKIYDIIQSDCIILKNISNLNELFEYLYSEYPELKNINFQVSVNKTIVKEKFDFKDGDEVALLPPFAGG